MPEPTLYLFDGYNLLNAGEFRDRQELIDRLAGFIALRGARGVVVFDGVGDEATHGALDVRFATEADGVIERLAASARSRERVCVISSDQAIRGTAGQEVRKVSSKEFVHELAGERAEGAPKQARRSRIEDALDAETRDELERWRRRRA